jgi:hypothetical protein
LQRHYPLNPATGLEDQAQLPWTNGVPSTGTEGSYPPFALCTDPQEEVLNAINGTGQTPGNDLTQLLQAISIGIFLGTFGGSANALTAALPTMQETVPALVAGMEFSGIAAASNTGAMTVTLTGFATAPGLKSIVHVDGTAIGFGEIVPGQFLRLKFDGTNFQLMNPPARVAHMLGFRNLLGSAPGGGKSGNWTIEQLVAAVSLGGQVYGGSNLSLAFNGATTGPGGMDAGSPPNSADLSIYAIYNPTTRAWASLGCAGSTSRGTVYSGANMPAGYTASILIWTGVTDGSGNIRQLDQIDRSVYTGPITVGSGLTGSSYSALGLATAVPANAKTWLPEGQCTTTSATSNIWLSPTASNGPGSSIMWSDVNRDAVTGTPVIVLTPQAAYCAISAGQTWTVNSIGYTF